MRHDRWTSDGYENDASTWTGTAATVLGAVVRWLIVLLAGHLGG
jgi:hypothetical protein